VFTLTERRSRIIKQDCFSIPVVSVVVFKTGKEADKRKKEKEKRLKIQFPRHFNKS
jgi:hypothetical protein